MDTQIWRITSNHRYLDALTFIDRFPAYTVTRRGEEMIWWYRRGDDVDMLRFHKMADGAELKVQGCTEIAVRAFGVRLEPLPADRFEDGLPEPYRVLHAKFAGIRPILFLNAFEGVAWSILGQQFTVKFAAQLKAAIARKWGTVVDDDLAVFPSPRQLATATVDQLRMLKLSQQKATALLSIAVAIADGTWSLESLYQKPTIEALAELQRIKGIGPWTAEYSLLRVFGHQDVLPAADVGLQRAWARTLGVNHVSEIELRKAGQVCKGYRSDFAFWLWLSNMDPV